MSAHARTWLDTGLVLNEWWLNNGVNEISGIADARATATLPMRVIDPPCRLLALVEWMHAARAPLGISLSHLFKKCLRVSGHPTLSVHSPGPPSSLSRRETGAWMRLFVPHFRPPLFVRWLLYGSQRLTRCLHNLRFSSFSRLAACHLLPRGNPGHGKRAAGSSCHISVHSCKGSWIFIFHQKWEHKWL